jgi:predicted ATPase
MNVALAYVHIEWAVPSSSPFFAQHPRLRLFSVTVHGFPHWEHWGAALRGWALAAQGQGEVGIRLLHQGLAALTTLGVRLALPHLMALLADACESMGRIEEGLTILAEAQTHVHDTGERYYEAELHRLKGELTLQRSSVQGPGSAQSERQQAKQVVSRRFSVLNRHPQAPKKLKLAFGRQLKWRASRKQSPWSCERQ